MTRENEMILKVLETQYKQNAREAHDFVKALGYEIFKYDGSFAVKNPKTGKSVHIENESKIYIGRRYIYGLYWGHNNGILQKMDFVNYLETPPNREFYRVIPESKYAEFRKILKNAKRDVDYHTRCIGEEEKDAEEKMQRIIERLAFNTKYHTRELSEAQERLERVRKEIKG